MCTGAVVRHGGTSPSKGTPYQGASPTRPDFGIDSFKIVVRLSKKNGFVVFLLVFGRACWKVVNVGTEIVLFSFLQTVATLAFCWSYQRLTPQSLTIKATLGLTGLLLLNLFLWCWQPWTFRTNAEAVNASTVRNFWCNWHFVSHISG